MDEMQYSSDVEYDTENKKKKFQMTRGMLLLIIIIVIAIFAIIIIGIKNKNSNKPKYTSRDFELLAERMLDESYTYISNNDIEIEEGSRLKIELSKLLLENGGSIDSKKTIAANVCDGYVLLIKKDEQLSFTPYLNCGDYYKSDGYEEKVVTTTSNVKDTISPVITLIGNKEITINVGDEYTDLGAKAADDNDGDLTSMIKTNGTVDTKKAGKYTIEYIVSDKSGNKGSEKRIVNVIEKITPTTTTPSAQTTKKTTSYTARTNQQTTVKHTVCSASPVITLKSKNGLATITLNVGTTYMEPGYTATDCNGNNITSSVSVSSNVNVNAAGTYQVVYTVTDFNGRTSKKTRTVFVKYTYVNVQGISVTPNNISLKVGESYSLEISVSPSNATDKSFSISSSNSSTVSVNKNGVITGKTKGTAIITARAGSFTSSCRVTVK